MRDKNNLYFYIYKTTCLVTGKCYVGQKSSKVKPHLDYRYLGSGKILRQAICKYGKDQFVKEIIEGFDDPYSLNERERFWIKKINCRQPLGYNIAEGSYGGRQSEEIRKKISDTLKRRWENLTQKEKDSHKKWERGHQSWNKGVSLSQEKRDQISNKLRGRKVSEQIKNKIRKIRDSRSEEYKNEINAKISRTSLGKKKPDSYKTNRARSTTKPVLQKTIDGQIFKIWLGGAREAALKLHYPKSGKQRINNACYSGSKLRGYYWEYCDDKISSVEEVIEIPDYVYNIEVEDNHNYFVNGILTHNCDDAQDPIMASSEVERKNTIDFYSNTLYSRLNSPDIGVRIIIQQRLNELDLTGYLMHKKIGRPNDHRHICIPGELDREILNPLDLEKYYTDGLFWSSRFSKSTLASFKRSLGSLQYAGQVGQRPAPPEGNLVRRAWFKIVPANLVQRDPNHSPVMFLLDTAYTEKQENDPSAVLACFEFNGTVFILNVAEVYMIFPDLIEFVKSYVAINDYSNMGSMIWVEPKASGKSLVQSLQRNSRLNVGEIESDLVNGKDKLGRLSTVSPYIQSGRVVLIEGAWNEMFLAQVCSFPNAAHDEFVDLLCYAIDTLLINNQGDLMGLM